MSALAGWLARQEKSHPNSIDLGLTRVSEVARRLGLLGSAEPGARTTLTVGGTNGKGSTVAFLDGMLRAAGKKVGRFTSPHLNRYNERICVDGQESGDEDLIAAFQRIDDARGDITLTFFEYNALAALDLFARARVDVAVLEVGLGGRLDATNIIDADVSVVTSIGIDHVDWLGHTAAQIAREKAGIFRAGRPAVLGSADMPASMFESIAAVGARAFVPGRDFRARVHSHGWDFEQGDFTLTDLPMPALSGQLQVINATTALAALVCAGFTPTFDEVARALRHTRIRGRFQVVPGEIEWIFDVAHNVPAAEGLRANLETLPRRRTLAICGVLGDKDIAGITAAIAPAVDAWILAGLEGPRAVATDDLESRLPMGARVLARESGVAAACRVALAMAAPGDRILVFGSFLTVGPALEFLGI
jgi:dihydrofolate synthase / folylpolyglutamate synthase